MASGLRSLGLVFLAKGKVGVIQVGALANMLMVVGSPATTHLIADPAHNFVVIKKDSQIYKNMAH